MPIRNLTLAMMILAAVSCNQENFKGESGRKNSAISRSFSQDAYPAASQTFNQGFNGEPQTDSFEQGEFGKLDILVVVDNSASMKEEQTNLASKLQPLLSKVEKADWQIGVVTTDPMNGCLTALIRKGDGNAAGKFQTAIMQAGINGSGTERGIGQAVAGLRCARAPLVREGSTVAVLILSDEDNCHIGDSDDENYGCQNEAGRNASHLTNYLSSIRTLGKDARVYGIIWEPATSQSQCSTALNRGRIYNEAILASNGKSGSICDSDYTRTLQAISDDVAQILKYEFEIAHVPDEGTLQILVNGQNWDKFTLQDRLVKFTEPPPFGAKVEVVYKYGKGGAIAGRFALSKNAVEGSFKVTVDGQEVPESSYTFDAASNTLVFHDPPAERAVIKVDFKEKVELKRTFVISVSAEPKTIEVTVDGKKVSGFKFDATTGTVTLAEPAPESAKVVVTFKEKL